MADGPDGQGEPDQLLLAQTELHDAISQVLNRRGLMPTKWMLGVEGLDGNGGRVLETFTSPDFRAWDSIGVLGFLDARERGSVGADAAADMRGDGSD